jgi:uncharacterized protein DUF6918
MTATLTEILLAPDTKQQVIDDCLTLIDQQVADTAGAAIKLAYKTVSTVASGYLRKTVKNLLPELAEQLQPYWTEFTSSGGSDFGDYLAKRSDEVTEALLSVSDDHAARSDRPVVIKAYQSVRGGASKQIEAALPQVGALVQKFAG